MGLVITNSMQVELV